VLQGRVMGRADFQLAAPDPPGTREQAPRRGPRGPLAVGVVDAPVARAHEQARLREPFDRAAEMGAIHGEDQEPVRSAVAGRLAPDVYAGVRDHAVPGLAERVVEGDEPGLA